MTIYRLFDKNISVFLILSILLLIVSLVVGYLFKQSPDPSKIVKEIQEKILQKDAETILTIDKISSVLPENSDSLFQQFVYLENKYETDGFMFLVYKSDSLIYWSNNLAPLESITNNLSDAIIFTENAWYRKLIHTHGSFQIVGLYLIKNAFFYQNEYLTNSFHSSFYLKIDANLNTTKSFFNIYSAQGQFLFSLDFKTKSELTSNHTFLLLLLYLLTMLVFIRLIFEIHLWYYRKKRKLPIFLFGFSINIIVFRLIIFYFKLPGILYSTDLFSPKYYAYSDFLPSIGDFFINVVCLFLVILFLFKHLKFNLKFRKLRTVSKIILIFILFGLVIVLYNILIFTFESLIIDSNISSDLNNIFGINPTSILMFLIFALLIFSFFLITSKLCYFSSRINSNLSHYVLTLIFVSLIIKILVYNTLLNIEWPYFFLILAYTCSFGIFFYFKINKFSISNIAFYLIFFSILSTYCLYNFNGNKEYETRKLLAINLASDQKDPLAEFLIKDLTTKVASDTIMLNHLKRYKSFSFDNKIIEKYLNDRYFSGYWKKYNQQFTICDEVDSLYFQSENSYVGCAEFFNYLANFSGHPTQNDNMYFINYGSGDNGYLIALKFVLNDSIHESPITIYVELTPKYISKEFGFPDLLIDKQISKNSDLANYSYAKYQAGKLINRVGLFNYKSELLSSHQDFFNKQFQFFDDNNYSHLLYRIDTKHDLIISIKQKSFIDLISPFSYIFLFYGVLILIIFFLLTFPISKYHFNFTFRTRLQMMMAFLLLFSFLIIGSFTVNYIYNLNEQKNKDILNEKTHSVLVELQQKFSNEQHFDAKISPIVGDLLVKFSTVFFSDINIFDLNGNLISTSRPQIYDEFLISRKMNSTAFRELNNNKSSFYIQTEHIGKQNYLSAYIPFVNANNLIIAYLNLPYFAKQNALEAEISTFLVTYINIYVILIALSILVALAISNYISRPIKLIMRKISQVNFGGKNEKITWARKDEIGQLVFEYNRMIDELALSAGLLAKSERESAWREMAKQVAHEIKNPLTPMKLSVQYLQKTYFDKVPDWDKRLEKFTQTMIEQIETLSTVASGFSDFAKMPESNKQIVDIQLVLQNSISLYKNYEKIHFHLLQNENIPFLVLVDREQLLRAFNNLFKNAVQAIGEENHGNISISIQKKDKTCAIEISDSGKGIPEEYFDKIFFPNFTTKSGGMGLGLAIVKNIIVSFGGEISFYSEKEKGTTFKIMLPLVI